MPASLLTFMDSLAMRAFLYDPSVIVSSVHRPLAYEGQLAASNTPVPLREQIRA